MSTFRSFVDALEAIVVVGVVKRYTQGPPVSQPASGECPFQYVRYPRSTEVPLVFGEQGGWMTRTAELVIGVEPVGQNITFENFDNTVDLMDNLETALQGADCYTKSKLNWAIRQEDDPVAGQMYWAIIATVEGTG